MANRYYQQNIAQYNPLTMEEMLFAPMQLRQRHDALDAGLIAEQDALSQYNALTQDQPFVQQEIDPLNQQIEKLSQSLATEGYDPNKMSQITKLRQQRKQMFSPTGSVGLAQNRFNTYQQQVEQLRKQYEDNPEIANYYANNLLTGTQGLSRDEEGNIINRNLAQINNVRHIPDEEIMEQINNVVKGLKPSDLAAMGIKHAGQLGSFNDLYTIADQQGLDIGRIQNAILSQLGPETLSSIQQYGQVQGIGAEQAVTNFSNRLDKLASASAYIDTNRRFFNVSNDLKIHAAKKRLDEEMDIPLVTPGGQYNPTVTNPFNLTIKNGRPVYNKRISSFDPSGIANKEYVDSDGNVVSASEAVKSFRPVGTSGQVTPILNEGYKTKNMDAVAVKERTDEELSKLHDLKTVIPSLRNKTDPEALEQIDNYYENISKTFGTVSSPSYDVLKTMSTRILGDESNTGDIFNRQVLNAQGGLGDWETVRESLGYNSDADMIKEGKPTVKGVRHLPGVGATYEVNVKDNKGQGKSIFVEADNFVTQQSMKSAAISQAINEGAIFEPVYQTQQYDKQGNPHNITSYVVNNFGGDPLVVEAIEGVDIDPKDVVGKNKEQIQKEIQTKYGFTPRVRTLNDIIENERANINSSLKSYFK